MAAEVQYFTRRVRYIGTGSVRKRRDSLKFRPKTDEVLIDSFVLYFVKYGGKAGVSRRIPVIERRNKRFPEILLLWGAKGWRRSSGRKREKARWAEGKGKPRCMAGISFLSLEHKSYSLYCVPFHMHPPHPTHAADAAAFAIVGSGSRHKPGGVFATYYYCTGAQILFFPLPPTLGTALTEAPPFAAADDCSERFFLRLITLGGLLGKRLMWRGRETNVGWE